MNDIAQSTDLVSLAEDFIAIKQESLSRELAEKYLVTKDEVSDVVDSFLRDTYGPALNLAESIQRKKQAVLLFIGKKDCAICQRCRPVLEEFIGEHKDLDPVILDYSQPEGLLYHLIHREDQGMLPLIAFIFQGKIIMNTCGECAAAEVYEKFFNDIGRGCSQNIYVH